MFARSFEIFTPLLLVVLATNTGYTTIIADNPAEGKLTLPDIVARSCAIVRRTSV